MQGLRIAWALDFVVMNHWLNAAYVLSHSHVRLLEEVIQTKPKQYCPEDQSGRLPIFLGLQISFGCR